MFLHRLRPHLMARELSSTLAGSAIHQQQQQRAPLLSLSSLCSLSTLSPWSTLTAPSGSVLRSSVVAGTAGAGTGTAAKPLATGSLSCALAPATTHGQLCSARHKSTSAVGSSTSRVTSRSNTLLSERKAQALQGGGDDGSAKASDANTIAAAAKMTEVGRILDPYIPLEPKDLPPLLSFAGIKKRWEQSFRRMRVYFSALGFKKEEPLFDVGAFPAKAAALANEATYCMYMRNHARLKEISCKGIYEKVFAHVVLKSKPEFREAAKPELVNFVMIKHPIVPSIVFAQATVKMCQYEGKVTQPIVSYVVFERKQGTVDWKIVGKVDAAAVRAAQLELDKAIKSKSA